MSYTVGQVIEKLLSPVIPLPKSTDTLKSGDPSQEVTGIAVMFTATINAIKQATEAGANMIITHEPTFYQHDDKTEHVQQDSVIKAKLALIEEKKVAIFRFHDYFHRYEPDGITMGMLKALDWERYSNPATPEKASILNIPPTTVGEVAQHLKQKLGLPMVQLVGDPSMVCQRIAFAAGFGGCGAMALPLYMGEGVELVIAGETLEWETPEYVRDAVELGENKALLIIGHLKSEEAGMESLVDIISEWFPEVPVKFIQENPVFNHIL